MQEEISRILSEKSKQKARRLAKKISTSEIASALNHYPSNRVKLFGLLSPGRQSDIMVLVTEKTSSVLVNNLSEKSLVKMLHESDEDDATDIIQDLPEKQQQKTLKKLESHKAKAIAKLLPFGKETAGGIMDLNFITVSEKHAMKSVAVKYKKHVDRIDRAPTVLVVDSKKHLIGYIPVEDLILAKKTKAIKKLVQRISTIDHHLTKKQLLRKAALLRTDKMVVVDEHGHPLGIVHAKDLVSILQDSHSLSLSHFAGVKNEESANDGPFRAVRLRYKWLILNLGTALLAALTVSLFKETISQMVILAAYMPVVAGMGGNAGSQAVAVMVRGIALGEVAAGNAIKLITKELIAGLFNGVIVGVVMGVVAVFLGETMMLGVVLGLALIINLVVAGLFGSLVPVTLRAMHLDPALSASIFVTTATDVLGFLAFLGLAGAILL